MLMRVGPRYPGLFDESEGSYRRLSAQYQCLKTVSPLCPDADAALPRYCVAGRSCFVARDRG